MNKAAVKAFAVGARKSLTVQARKNAESILAQGGGFSRSLGEDVDQKGLPAVAEEAAYYWFTRIIAVRYLEVNGYLPDSAHILSPSAPEPEQVDERFTARFLKTCRALTRILPDYFKMPDEYLDALITLSLRDKNGVVRTLLDTVPESDFLGAVEIVGWLYQYYNSERKNEAIRLLDRKVKREDVPAATQFFTTDWVVRYMVNNSLGKYWMERHPESDLREKLEFYLEPAEKKPPEHSGQSLSPEEIRVMDPCMGSGHILVYAFDLLMEIYRECGYSDYDASALILKKNLYGLDIDSRSYRLAYFALMMKARRYHADILTQGLRLNLYEIRESNELGDDLIAFAANGDKEMEKDLLELTISLYDAKEYGSIVPVAPVDFACVYRRIEEIRRMSCADLYELAHRNDALEKLLPLIKQAQVMTEKYEVVATNPPYLCKMDTKLKRFVKKHYQDFRGDLFAVFMYRNLDFCRENGYCAFMSPFVWMFIRSYEKLREFILKNKSVSSLIQLEYSAFEEATVPICTFVLKNGSESEKGVYLKLSDFRGGMEIQRQKVAEAIRNPNCGYRYEVSLNRFSSIPGMPIAYWGSGRFAELFTGLPALGETAAVTNGLFTCDNNRFLRFWYEVPRKNIFFGCTDRVTCEKSEKVWFPYNKGGDFRKWYGNHDYVVNFKGFGEEISAYRVLSGQSASFPGQKYYFQPGVSWSFVSSSKFGVRYYPEGFVFDIAGSSVFAGTPEDTLVILGFLSSKVAFEMLNLINPTLNYQAGNVAKLPLHINEACRKRVCDLVSENIELSKADWDSFETSWNFELHPLVRFRLKQKAAGAPSSSLEELYSKWDNVCRARFFRMKENEEELNRIFIDDYGLQKELTPKAEGRDISVRNADLSRDIRSLVSFAVGCLFGRYRIPDTEIPPANVLSVPDGISVPGDITERFLEFVEEVFGKDTLSLNLTFIAGALGGREKEPQKAIRDYFFRKFFQDHVRVYRKRPVYWMFDGAAVRVLCYAHTYGEPTARQAISVFNSAIAALSRKMEAAPTPAKKEKLAKQLTRLEQYRGKLQRIAECHISIDLNDGILKNYQKIQGGESLLAKIT